jgi:hypothetical protein
MNEKLTVVNTNRFSGNVNIYRHLKITKQPKTIAVGFNGRLDLLKWCHSLLLCVLESVRQRKKFSNWKTYVFSLSSVWSAIFHKIFYFTTVSGSESKSKLFFRISLFVKIISAYLPTLWTSSKCYKNCQRTKYYHHSIFNLCAIIRVLGWCLIAPCTLFLIKYYNIRHYCRLNVYIFPLYGLL